MIPTPDPVTPGACARTAYRFRDGSPREKALAALRDAGDRGATADEVAGATGCRINSISTAISQLARLGLVFNSRKARRTATGRPAVVWTTVAP